MNGKARIPKSLLPRHSSGEHMYFARIAIIHSGCKLLITPRKINLNGDIFRWNMTGRRCSQNIKLKRFNGDSLYVFIAISHSSFKLKFINHRHFLEVVKEAIGWFARCDVQRSNTIQYIFSYK